MSSVGLGLPSFGRLNAEDTSALLGCQTRVLALMSANSTQQLLLDEITRSLEELMPDSLCSLLLIDSAGLLRHGSAPTLPQSYLAAIDGVAPGPGQGSCGTAAHLNAPVFVEDIPHDDRWRDYHDIAAAAGLRACWSTPVQGRSGRVVATFAVYHRDVRRPTARELQIVERLTYLVSVVLKHATVIGDLMVSEERFRRAFEDNATAIGLLDTRGMFARVNAAMQTLTGERLVPGLTRLADVVTGDGADDVLALFDQVRTGSLRHATGETRVHDGRVERVVSLTMSIVRGATDETHQVSVTLVDLTERLAAKRERRRRIDAEVAQRSAEQASHAKSAFLAAMSHEMRTPLQAITGFAELLGTLAMDADRRTEALGHITAGARHLLTLVDDTLDLSRIEAGALPLTLRTMPTGPLIAEVLDFLAPVAADHGVAVHFGPCQGVVRADERRLRQVLINLVTNALRYSGPEGEVTVGTRALTSTIRITVADNGPGIAGEVRARMFEPFVRADATSAGGVDRSADDRPTGGVHGIGLGLMLASGLTAHGRPADHRRPTDRVGHRGDGRTTGRVAALSGRRSRAGAAGGPAGGPRAAARRPRADPVRDRRGR